MILTYFELKTRNIDAVKDDPDFIKKHGKEFMRAFQEEMEYAVYHALCNSTDINEDLGRIVEKYRFNKDMDILLSAVAFPVKDANLTKYFALLRQSKVSKEAEGCIKNFCRLRMDMMRSHEICPGPPSKMTERSEETDKLIKEINEKLKKRNNNMKKNVPIMVLMLLMIAGCHRSMGVVEGIMTGISDSIEMNSNGSESFTVVYLQPVNDYKVKALLKRSLYDTNCADITFVKNGKSFTLSTSSFGDSLFNKGGWGMDGTNDGIIKKHHNETFYANYHATKVDWKYEPDETPFFFKDMDFDGEVELVIVHYRVAVRNHDGYDVYRIVDEDPVLIEYPPFKTNDDFGMTDYSEFDYKNKTITCPYPEGPGGLGYEGQVIYGISKKEKDTVVVNGRKHLFNHIEMIKDIKFD